MGGVSDFATAEVRVHFFQERIVRMVTHWRDHPAVQQLEVAYLDRERDAILKAISLGLDFDLAWPLVKPLVIALTPYMERRGHWDAWYTLLNRAIATAQKLTDLNGETTLTALLARLCQRMSRPQEVVHYYRRSIRLARQTGNRFEEARACSNLGFLYIDGGHWWRAEALSYHALAIFEGLESAHGQAHTHNHLGVLFVRQRQWDSAEIHLQRACEIWRQQNDVHSLIYGFLNLGLLYGEQAMPEKAVDVLNRALQFAESSGEQSLVGGILNNLAIAHRFSGNFREALRLALEAEKLHRHFSLKLELAQVWHNLGLIYTCIGELIIAIRFLEASKRMYLQLNHTSGVKAVTADLERFT
ncbi:MAG: tetratricopeptide repeat protein [Caldilineaceae bacterium]